MNSTAPLIPVKAPASVLGTTSYYQWREKDRKRRLGNHSASYYQEFGDKYATRFMERTYHLLSEHGKEWSRKVLLSLQEYLEHLLDHYPMIECNENKLRRMVVDHHIHAYRDAGFNLLSMRDKFHIVRSIDLKDLLSVNGFSQAYKILLL